MEELRQEINAVKKSMDILDEEMKNGYTQQQKYRKQQLLERYNNLLNRLEMWVEMR